MPQREWHTREMSLDALMPMEHNPRTISDRSYSGLVRSIERFGFVEPIVWNERTGHVVGGHQRLRALKELGHEMGLVVVVDMPESEEVPANMTLNNPEIEGEWSEPILDLLSQLEQADRDLYDGLNMENLRRGIEGRTPSGINGDEDDDDDDDLLTTCPCCGHEWELDAGDVSSEKEM